MIVRNQILSILATCSLSLPLYAQNKAAIINDIKKEFRSINSDTTYKLVTLENEDFLESNPDGGGELIGYFKGKQIKKIWQWIGVSTGNEVKEFYFKNGQLIFGYVKFNSFVFDAKKQELDLSKTVTTFEGRYYFNNKKLIDHAETGNSRVEDDKVEPGEVLIAEAANKLKLLTKKNNTN